MLKVIEGDNNGLEQQLAKALFGTDEVLIQNLIQQLNSKSRPDKKVTLKVISAEANPSSEN